jgi:TRAP-type C4-dicarboxylate transport system permease small subunit
LGLGAAFMGYMGWRTLNDSLLFGSVSSSPLQVPLWIPQSLWMAGLCLFGLSALWTAVRGLLALRHGLEAADRLLVPPSVAEEIEEARR